MELIAMRDRQRELTKAFDWIGIVELERMADGFLQGWSRREGMIIDQLSQPKEQHADNAQPK